MMKESLHYFREERGHYALPEGSAAGCSYSKLIDFEFVLALATIGEVSMTSTQVSVRIVGAKSLKHLQVPANARLEWCYAERLNDEQFVGAATVLRFVFEMSQPEGASL